MQPREEFLLIFSFLTRITYKSHVTLFEKCKIGDRKTINNLQFSSGIRDILCPLLYFKLCRLCPCTLGFFTLLWKHLTNKQMNKQTTTNKKITEQSL